MRKQDELTCYHAKTTQWMQYHIIRHLSDGPMSWSQPWNKKDDVKKDIITKNDLYRSIWMVSPGPIMD